MIIPKVRICECPSCKEYFTESTSFFDSDGNGKVWSDGEIYQLFHSMERDSYFSRCDCGAFVWINKVIIIDEIEIYNESFDKNMKKWVITRSLNNPSEEDYLNALNAGIPENINEEMYLRVKAWRASNHPVREELIEEGFEKERKAEIAFLHHKERTDIKSKLFKEIEKSNDTHKKNILLKQISSIDSESYSRKSKGIKNCLVPHTRSILAKKNMEILCRNRKTRGNVIS